MLKKGDAERKTFKNLCQQEFACEQDALKALSQWRKKQSYLDVDGAVNTVQVYSGKGRPAAGQKPERTYFQISGALFSPLSNRNAALKQIGLFIIATNDLSSELTMEKALTLYKSQQAVEKGFRFLKSPDFLTSSIYLKKPERIEALLMVMTTCLMVYAALEHQIRKQLQAKDMYFPSQKKKPSQKPTARWVFQCFEAVTLLYLEDQPPIVVNKKDRQQVIIDCLGSIYREIYS